MPYISTEQVKEVRTELKKQFPEFKFSIVRRDYSCISVHIISGPLNFGVDYQQVYKYYIIEHYKGQAGKILQKISDIMNRENYTASHDADYGAIPHYYTSLSIGQWDKKYELKKA